MPDTPPPTDPTIADAIRRVALDDAGRYDVTRGRRLLDAKLSQQAKATRETMSNVVPDALSDAGTTPDSVIPFRDTRRHGLPKTHRTHAPHDHPLRLTRAGRIALWAAVGSAMTLLFSIAIWRHTASDTPRPDIRTYATRIGQRADVTLADGSRIVLAPDSRLDVPPDFGTATRTVTLRGEAYMTVTHATGAPFIVRTGTVEARVLGTTFDVRHYPEDPAVRVAVVTGRIAERNWRGTIHLAAGDVSLMTDSSATVMTDPDVQSSVAWTQGQLTFTDTPVPAMLATLGRWYGYQFELEDSTLTTRYVTASFDVTKPDEAMVVLRKMLGVTVRIDGSHVTLQAQLRTQRGPVPTRRGTAELLPTSTEVGR